MLILLNHPNFFRDKCCLNLAASFLCLGMSREVAIPRSVLAIDVVADQAATFERRRLQQSTSNPSRTLSLSALHGYDWDTLQISASLHMTVTAVRD